jgi:hypothetical protein
LGGARGGFKILKKMKKYSDYFSGLKRLLKRVGNRTATTALFMVAVITMSFAQEPYHFIEGSVHHFSVAPNSENTFQWVMCIDPYLGIYMPTASYDLMDGGTSPDLTIRFNDMDRVNTELVYLVVEETNPSGCSTKRALQIQIEPNNMYLEFASAIAQECFNTDIYQAPLKVGLNFRDKAAGDTIPAKFFPLLVTYTVKNLTAGTVAVPGNGGEPVAIAFSSINDYYLLIPEAVGLPDQTTEYRLVITSVKDKYDTDFSKNGVDSVQIRIINHLPQSGNMDMALAYYIIK